MNYKLLISFAILGAISYWSITTRKEKDRNERKETLELSLELGKEIYKKILFEQKDGVINVKKRDSIFKVRKLEMVKTISE